VGVPLFSDMIRSDRIHAINICAHRRVKYSSVLILYLRGTEIELRENIYLSGFDNPLAFLRHKQGKIDTLQNACISSNSI
jgi:hypothetical protein